MAESQTKEKNSLGVRDKDWDTQRLSRLDIRVYGSRERSRPESKVGRSPAQTQ